MNKKIMWYYVFKALNKKYWKSKYRSIPVFLMRLDGEKLGEYRCSPAGINSILLAKNQGLTNIELMGVLLHEMCHHVVFEKYGIDVDPHGKEWIREMKKVGFEGVINEKTCGLNKFSEKEFSEIILEHDYLCIKEGIGEVR